MKKLIYADTFSCGSFHEVFNASSLKMFANMYQSVIYYATASSCRSVKILLNGLPQNVSYRPLFIITFNNSFGNFIRHIISCIWNILILLFSDTNSTILFNYNSLWGTKWMNRIIRWRHLKVVIVCHGELEFLTVPSSSHPLNCLSTNSLKLFKSDKFRPAKNLYFCVLSKSILKNIQQVTTPNLRHKFISFEHTIIAQNVFPTQRRIKDSQILKIGLIGSIGKEKGLDNILHFGKMLEPYPNLEIYALGRVSHYSELLSQVGIKYIPGAEREYIPRKILEQYMNDMDCFVFLYNTNKYKFTASGALLDAIDHEKIIFSLHNDYFDHIFNQLNIGLQFKSIEILVDYLKSCNKNDFNRIDFKMNKQILSPEREAIICKETFLHRNLI